MNKYFIYSLAVFVLVMLFSPLLAQDTTITVTSDGNVGIGTTSPMEKLVVGNDLGLKIGAGNRITIGNNSGPSALNLGTDVNNRSFVFWNYVNRYLVFGTNNNNEFYGQTLVLRDGNVGIGLINPSAALHVSSEGGFDTPQGFLQQTGGDGFVRLRFQNAAENWWDIAGSANDQLRFYSATGTNDIMTLTADGNVGINTITPQDNLHVVGGLQLEKVGPELDRLVLKTASLNDPGRYGILFSNNIVAPFLGDDIADQHFDFYSKWGNQRTYDAVLSIHGKSEGSWGNVLRLTHDGSDGYITTDTGDLILNPEDGAANVGIGTNVPAGKLDVNGTIFQRGGQIHADYVFEEDYQLESIEEHAQHMWQNKHLTAIPKATYDENGMEYVEVGAHRKGIVEELEKAHIYIEQLNSRIKDLEAKLQQTISALNEEK